MDSTSIISTTQESITPTNQTHVFPFKISLSFEPLIDALKARVQEKGDDFALLERTVLDMMGKYPFLQSSISLDKLEDLKEYSAVVETLMKMVFPLGDWNNEVIAAVPPFSMQPFFHNQLFKELVNLDLPHLGAKNICAEEATRVKRLHAYLKILHAIYDWEVSFQAPMVIQFNDKQTGLDRYYWFKFMSDFIRIKPLSTPRTLSKSELIYLEDNIYNEDILAEYIDLSQYEFSGFALIQLSDATFPESLSLLKYELLNKEALTNRKAFDSLQQRLRELFILPDLRLGIAAFDIKRDRFHKQYHQITNGLLKTAEQDGVSCSQFTTCVYHKAIERGVPIVINDIKEHPNPSPIEEALLEQGIRSMLIAPLTYEGELIGLLEIGSVHPRTFKSDSVKRIEQVMPLFSLTLKRSYEDMEADIEAIMKNQFTAIHPVVEWRFEQEALKIKEQQSSHQQGNISGSEPIAFPEVYPLYGMSDIRNSSTERNNAIRADLETQMMLIDDLLNNLHKKQQILRVEQLRYNLRQFQESLQDGLNSGDELGILEFIDKEIHPILDHFNKVGTLDTSLYEAYQKRLDNSLGIIYEKRREFEESLSYINDIISDYLDETQKEAQEIFPHYFEKYKTDGVEYNIYLGESLTKDDDFHPVYLHNLRLWQLETMIQVAHITESIRSKLPLPLSTTHLILIHSNPIAIRFRLDEKKFDVDGAYNIRYEIVKKRIDKAYIKNTEERLTQPGTIALVYSQDKEAKEYEQYIRFLQQKKLIADEVEYLELEPLQGANGLKAIRLILNL